MLPIIVYIESVTDEGKWNCGNDTDIRSLSTQIKVWPTAHFHHKSQVDWPVNEPWPPH